MLARKVMSLKTGILTASLLLATVALVPYASADTITLDFSSLNGLSSGGASPTGSVTLTYGTNTHASSQFNPAAVFSQHKGQRYPWDPERSSAITGASGTFNDAVITGIQPITHAAPPPNEVLPYSYSTVGPAASSASYDNLFYSAGSPLVCFKDGHFVGPSAGGYFDIFGVAFTLDNGSLVDLWSNRTGDSNSPVVYSFKLTAVPAPGSLWLFAGTLLLALIVWRRRRPVTPRLASQ